MENKPILVVAATNRPNSLSQTVAMYYANYLQTQGSEAKLMKLTDLPADFTQAALYANKAKSRLFNELASQLQAAHKFVFIVPEYNGSFPGVFKAFIDGLDRNIFSAKKCALVGVSKGRQGAIMALSHLTDIFHYLGIAVYPIQPKLSNIRNTTLASVQAHSGYLDKLHKQADGFITF